MLDFVKIRTFNNLGFSTKCGKTLKIGKIALFAL